MKVTYDVGADLGNDRKGCLALLQAAAERVVLELLKGDVRVGQEIRMHVVLHGCVELLAALARPRVIGEQVLLGAILGHLLHLASRLRARGLHSFRGLRRWLLLLLLLLFFRSGLRLLRRLRALRHAAEPAALRSDLSAQKS